LLGAVVVDELIEHVDDAEDRAGGLARCRAELRQRVKGSIEIRRAVD
jgi:hypothetical protein